MDTSIFMDKEIIPDESMLRHVLSENYTYWDTLRQYTYAKYPTATEEWTYSGKNYGWSFRIKDKKRAIIYLLPREGYFLAAFIFGGKATEAILAREFSDHIKTDLASARVYAEGRGIRIKVEGLSLLDELKRLIDIKLAY